MGIKRIAPFAWIVISFLVGNWVQIRVRLYNVEPAASSIVLPANNSLAKAGETDDQARRERRGNFATVLKCLFDIEQPLMRLQHEWRASHVPILHSMIQVNGIYKIIFLLHYEKRKYDSWTQPGHSIWTCNGVQADTSGTPPQKFKERSVGRSVFVLDCPLDVHTIVVNRTLFPGVGVEYKTDILRKCADLDDTKGLPVPAPNKIACTMIQGTYKELREWLEYNRLIGFDHFLVYVNEPYDANLMPQSSDITYVPWNYTFAKNELGIPHQSAQLCDCQLRALARNVTWVGIMDVDEYFHILNQSSSLDEILRSHETDVRLGALQMPSWFYGHKIDQLSSTDPFPSRYDNSTLVMDGTWRSSTPHLDGREKLLIRPSNVVYFTPHHIEAGGAMKAEPRIRLHHYKHVDREGIFSENANGSDAIVHDDSLVRQYGPLMRQRLGMVDRNP